MKKKYANVSTVTITFLLSLCFSLLAVANSSQDDYEKALTTFNKNLYDEAFIHVKNSLQADPDNLPSKILLAKLLTIQGKFDTAEIEFSEIIQQGGDIGSFAEYWGRTLLVLKKYEQIIYFNQVNSFSISQQIVWHEIKAMACIRSDNYECAAESFERIGEIDNTPVKKLNGLAQLQIEQNNFQQAEALLNQAVIFAPQNITTLQLLGIVNRSLGKLDIALEYLHTAYEIAPEDPYILRNLADVYLASNNTSGAKEMIDTILSQAPNDPFAILVDSLFLKDNKQSATKQKAFIDLSAKVYALPAEIVDAEPTLLLLRGLVSFVQKNYEQALRDFSSLNLLKKDDEQATILLAQSLFALNKNKEAIELLEINLKNLTHNSDILVLLGEAYLKKHKTFKAYDLLTDLQNRFPNNINVKLFAIKLAIVRGQSIKGFRDLDDLLDENPTDQEVLLVHSVLSLQGQRYAKALNSINTLLSIEPDNEKWLNTKAAIYIRQNKLDEAQEIIDRLLAENHQLFSARFNLATIYSLRNEDEQAKKIAESIIQSKPDHIPSLILLAETESKQNNYQDALQRLHIALRFEADNVEALEVLVNILIQQKNFLEALKQLNKLDKIVSDNPKYVIQKAYLYLALNDKENSQKQVSRLQLLALKETPLLLMLSQIQTKLEDLKGAESSLRLALHLDPDSLTLGEKLTEVLINSEQVAAAELELQKLNARYTNNASLLFLHGRLAELQGKTKEAQEYYTKTLQADDTFELALAKLYVLTQNGMPLAEFESLNSQLVKRYPERYFPRNLLAQFYYYNNQKVKAAEQYEILLARNDAPNRAALLNRLATIYMLTDLPKSEEYAHAAYSLNKEDVAILTSYGWILVQLNKVSEGLNLLRQAYSRNSQNVNLHYYIAVSLEKLGLIPDAISELKTLFNKNVDFAESNEARALFKKLTDV